MHFGLTVTGASCEVIMEKIRVVYYNHIFMYQIGYANVEAIVISVDECYGSVVVVSVPTTSIGNRVLPTPRFPTASVQAPRVSKDVGLATIVSNSVGEYSRASVESVPFVLGVETSSLVVSLVRALGVSKDVVGPATIVSDSVGECSMAIVVDSVPVVPGVETLSPVVAPVWALRVSMDVIGPMTVASVSVGECSRATIEESAPRNESNVASPAQALEGKMLFILDSLMVKSIAQFRNSLVGRFYSNRPNIDVVRGWVLRIWKLRG